MTTTPTAPIGPDAAAPQAPAGVAEDAMRAGKAPVGTGSSPLFAQLIALALICTGVVGVQSLLVSFGAVAGPSWISWTIEAANGIRGGSAAVLAAGITAIVLGVLLLPVVFKRRPRKGVELSANTGVHLRPRDLARIAESALDGADAVTGVHVKATRRQIRIAATTVAGKDGNTAVVEDIRTRLHPALAALERQPRVKVTVHNEEI